MSLTQRARSVFKRMPNPKRLLRTRHGVDSVDYSELMNTWPDGTWTMKWRYPNGEMDLLTRGYLLDAWGAEEVFKVRRMFPGVSIDPAKFTYPPSIDKGWKPSAAALKELAKQCGTEPQFISYVMAKLETDGRLAA